jgi:hypothetical protein
VSAVFVVVQPFGQHAPCVFLVQDEDLVEQFPAQGSDHAFADGVGAWRPHRAAQDLDAFGLEEGVEGRGEAAVAVADEVFNRLGAVVEFQIHQRVACARSVRPNRYGSYK